MVVHHHAIIVAAVGRRSSEITCDDLRTFLSGLVSAISMQQLFDPIAIRGKYGFTGIVGIVTSHIAFHFFESDQSLHLDVYSCKQFDLGNLVKAVDQYWNMQHADVLFIRRDDGPSVQRYRYDQKSLTLEADYER